MRITREQIAEIIEQDSAPAGIVDFFDIVSGDSFDVAPEKALMFFRAKGLSPTFSYLDAIGKTSQQAFTVAKMMDVDMLAQVRASMDSALANGTTFREWRETITPILQAGGWWGRKEVVDPLTGQTVVAQLGSPARLETIFRTNMQSAYAAGQWDEIQAGAADAPFLLYDAIDDFRTRPAHAAWDGKVLPANHPWWRTHFPPNGYNCRCGTIALSRTDLQRMGLAVSPEPSDGTYQWTNPRTGEVVQVPTGLDPGFAANPGVSGLQNLRALLDEKVAALGPEERRAARSSIREHDQAVERTGAGIIAARTAQAAADAQPAVDRASAAINRSDRNRALPNRVSAAVAKALEAYRRAVGRGKAPTAAQSRAVDSLPDEQRRVFLDSIAGADQAGAASAAATSSPAQRQIIETIAALAGMREIVVERGEKQRLVAALKRLGYESWPDGRSFDEVIVERE